MPTVYDNWLRIKVITEGANRKYFLTVEIAVAHCRSEPYVYGLVYSLVLDFERPKYSEQ